jgi:hypothetical protein
VEERKQATMTLQELREVLQKEPFQPFRIVLTDGPTYEVWRPQQCVFGVSVAFIVKIEKRSSNDLQQTCILVNPARILRLESLKPAAPEQAEP